MAVWEALKVLTAQLSTAATTEDIGQSLLAAAKRVGLSNVAIVEAGGVANPDSSHVLFTSADHLLSPEFEGRAVTSLTFLHARAAAEPFTLSEALHTGRPNGGDGHVTWTDGAEQKGKDGLVVPVHIDGELTWFIVFTGSNCDITQPVRAMLTAAAHAAIGRHVEQMQRPASGVFLSAREFECLRWVADGKTDAEVGQILNITARTVRFHIRNAKEKLGVTTRIQAVAMRARGAVACNRRPIARSA